MRPRTLLLLLVALVPFAAHASDPYQAQFDKLRAEAIAKRSAAEAPLPLWRAYGLADTLPSLEPLAKLYRETAGSPAASPELRALARWLLASVEERRGDPKSAEAQRGRLGFLTKLALLGPFDNEGKRGCDIAYPPEQTLALEGSFRGKVRDIAWRAIPEEAARSGFINLGAALDPSNESVSYLLALLDSPRDQRVVVHLGSSGASRLFLNGEKVFADDTYHPSQFDQRHVAMTLRKGTNRLMLKLCQNSGSAGVYLRTTDPGGRPAPLTQRAPPPFGDAASRPLPPLPSSRTPATARALPTFADALAKDPTKLAAYAELLLATRAYDETQRTPYVAASRAASENPDSAGNQRLAGSTAEDSNERKQYYERAVQLAPRDANAVEALARWRIDDGQTRKALDLLEPFVASNPDHFTLALLLVHALDAFDLTERAEALQRDLHERFSDRVPVIEEEARWARRRGRVAEQVALWEKLVTLNAADGESRRKLAEAKLDRGDVDGALTEFSTAARFDPWNLSVLSRAAEIASANGRETEARAAWAAALAIAPQDASLHQRQGESLTLLGLPDEALAAFERSLALNPQNTQLQELIRTLRGATARFEDAFAKDLATLAKTPPAPGEDAVILSDLTAVRLLPNGLAQRYVQLIERVQTARGAEAERTQQIGWAPDRQSLTILAARILKPDGTILNAHSESDRSLSDTSVQLYYDARLRLVSFPNLDAGDVFELSFRLDDVASDNLLSDSFGDVGIVRSFVRKESFDYFLSVPAGRKVWASGPDLLTHDEIPEPDGTTLLRWSAKALPRLVGEPGMPPLVEVAQPLHVSTFASWDDVARFYWGLVRDQLAPGEPLRQIVRDARARVPAGDEAALIRELYTFVVKRTRYVGLEFGIHGYKPYSVETVLSRRFGDCKDKASLLKALLGEAGIDSRLTLLRMNNLGRLPPTPASLAIFNHAILYIPKHDLFLDGTAEFHGSRETPVVDQGAMVLVVNPDGTNGIDTVPMRPAQANRLTNVYTVTLAADGSATVEGTLGASGSFAPSYRRAYTPAESRAQRLEQSFAGVFAKTEVRALDVGDLDDWEQDVTLRFSLGVPRYAEERGSALAFTPLAQRTTLVETLAALSIRKQRLELEYPFERETRVAITLPNGKTAKAPADTVIESPFGRYEARWRAEGGKVKVDSALRIDATRIEPADYAAFRGFLTKVDDAHRETIRAK